MKTIEWDEAWALGIKNIDEQHKVLIDLLNKISKTNANALGVINEFIAYASDHFADEEALMMLQKYDRKNYLTHKKEHRAFKDALLEVSFKLLEIRNDAVELERVVTGFRKFCFAWFEVHFLSTDKMMTDFIKAGGGADSGFDYFLNNQ